MAASRTSSAEGCLDMIMRGMMTPSSSAPKAIQIGKLPCRIAQDCGRKEHEVNSGSTGPMDRPVTDSGGEHR